MKRILSWWHIFQHIFQSSFRSALCRISKFLLLRVPVEGSAHKTQSHPSPPPLYLSVSEQTLFVLSETQTQYFPTAIEPPSPLNLPARFIHPSQLYQCSSCLPIPLSLPVRAAQDNGRLLRVLFSCVVVIVVFMVSLSASQAHCIPTGC